MLTQKTGGGDSATRARHPCIGGFSRSNPKPPSLSSTEVPIFTQKTTAAIHPCIWAAWQLRKVKPQNRLSLSSIAVPTFTQKTTIGQDTPAYSGYSRSNRNRHRSHRQGRRHSRKRQRPRRYTPALCGYQKVKPKLPSPLSSTGVRMLML